MARTYHHGRRMKDKNNLWRNWSRNEPRYWRRYYKHKKRRAAAREAQGKVMKGDMEQLWPLDKKPWIYYW